MRNILLSLLVILFSLPAQAGIRLKPGPQLWVFATRGDLASVKKLVETNAFDKQVLGRALFNSLRRSDLVRSPDNLSIVRLFLAYGAEPNYRALNGQTPLITATLANNGEAVKLLLESGGDASIADQGGKRPIDYASGMAGAEAVVTLLKNPPALKKIERVHIEPKILNLDLSMEGTNVMMIFDLVAEGPVCVRVVGSLDGGANYDMKFRGASGDVGSGVAPGERKKIVWTSSVDYPSGFSDVDALIDVVAEKCR